jgi:hypothetical protein
MPIAIAAHNDRKIRMYDMRAGKVTFNGCTDVRAQGMVINS